MALSIFPVGGLSIFDDKYSLSLLPSADNTYDLGSAALSWRSIYFDTAIVGGTVSGSWSPDSAGDHSLGSATAEWLDLFLGSDGFVKFGLAQEAQIGWETADANANELILALPAGAGNNVPVLVIADQGIINVDLGLYNGVVDPRVAILSSGAVTTAPIIEFRKSRGTTGVPTIITTGDDLGSINFYGYSGSTGYHLSAAIEVDSTGTIGPTGTIRVPSVMRFRTSTDAAPSVLTTAITIDQAQGVSFGAGITLGGNVSMANNSLANASTVQANSAFQANGNACALQANNTDANYLTFQARDSTVGLAEIGRLVGTADPYFQIGRDDTGVALNAVTDMLVLQAGGGTGNAAANFGFGISVLLSNAASEQEERASIDFELTTATNGTEDSRFVFSYMSDGVMLAPLSIGDTGSGTRVTHGVGIRTVKFTYHHDNAISNADGLTDSGNTWNQPAGSTLLGVKMVLDEQYTGTDPAPITDIDFTIGLAGDADGLLIPTMNGSSDAAGTAYTTRGAYWDTSAEGVFWYSQAATQWVIYATSVGCNLDHLTAGQISVYFTYLDIP